MNESAVGRLLGVLVAPGRTFRSIAERPTWWAPLLVLAILLGTVGYLGVQRIDIEDMVRQQAAKQQQELSAEQLDKGVSIMKKALPIGVVAQAVVFIPGALLLLALVFWVGFRMFGSDLSYPQSLSVAAHSFMPLAVSTLLTVPVLLGRQTLTLQEFQRGVLLSNLAAVAPEGANAGVIALLRSVDFFNIWILILLTLGYRTVAKVSTTAAAGTVITLWLLFVLGVAAIAFRFG